MEGSKIFFSCPVKTGVSLTAFFGCVNCRKMELAVWTNPKVSDIINNDYVLITLYVDNKTPLPSPVKIVENGTERTLRTVGDKWSYLQRVKFGANAQPFYVLIDNEGKPLTPEKVLPFQDWQSGR